MKHIITFLIACLCSITAFAQIDSTITDDKKITLTVGAVYANNVNYYGLKAAENMPYAAASTSLRLRSGIYFTGAGYRLLNDSGNIVSAGSVGAGVAFNIGKKVTADFSYSHTFFPKNSPFLQASNPDNASGSLKYEYWMTSGVNVDYNFGGQQDVFVTLSTEKLIGLGSFAKGKDLLTLTPSIEVVGGTQRFYETYLTEKRLRDSLLGIQLPPILSTPATESESTTRSTSQFNLISYNFKIPLAYNRSHYMIEAAYQLSVLGPEAAENNGGNTNSFFTFSIYYQF